MMNSIPIQVGFKQVSRAVADLYSSYREAKVALEKDKLAEEENNKNKKDDDKKDDKTTTTTATTTTKNENTSSTPEFKFEPEKKSDYLPKMKLLSFSGRANSALKAVDPEKVSRSFTALGSGKINNLLLIIMFHIYLFLFQPFLPLLLHFNLDLPKLSLLEHQLVNQYLIQ